MMAGIKNKNTKPERVLRSALHRRGLRFRIHDRRLPGSPDIVFPKWKVALFVHGCFWHRHEGCRYATTPATNVEVWRKKFSENCFRDRRNQNALAESGWRVGVVWECVLRDGADSNLTAEIAKFIKEGEACAAEWPKPE